MRNPHSLRVYHLAVQLNDTLATYRPPTRSPLYEAQRSAGSIEDNINEACYRQTESDFLRHLTYARASAAEAAGQLRRSGRNGQLPQDLADSLQDQAQHILACLIRLHRFNRERLGS